MDSPKKSDISKRILETRKQTEELKAQLQDLIDAGINSLEFNRTSEHSNFDKENIKGSQNKVQIIKSYDAKHSRHVNKPSSSNVITKQKDKKAQPIAKQESPKKVRSYDVNEAREYIKKQRERRMEQLKSQNNEKIKAELQKQKLLELRKKSLELVTKNVQAKRDRSKSRERTDYVRPDQNILTRNSSSSRERNFPGNGRLHISDYKKCGKSVEQSKNMKFEAAERIGSSSDYKVGRRKTKSEISQAEELTRKSTKEACDPNRNNNEKMKDSTSTNHLTSDPNIDIKQTPLKPVNLFNRQHSKGESVKDRSRKVKENIEDEIFLPVSNILDYKNSKNDCDITLPSREVNLKPARINLAQSNNPISDQKHNYQKPKSNQFEVAIGTDNLEKDSKETQTNVEQKVEFPLWLQERPVQAYPFNFINTVKRKLQYAVNIPKPSAVEIGVQSSLVKELSKSHTPEGSKTKEQILEVLQHSTKSSKKSNPNWLISHKGLNLDSKSMDHLELIPKELVHRSPTVTKISETESESDTSKNIPDISSESAHSLKKNFESVKQNGTSSLNVERISSMKLIPHNVKSTTNTIQSESGLHSSEVGQTEFLLKPTRILKSHRSDSRDTVNIERESKRNSIRSIHTVDNQYSSDFQSGSELSRSRESIISSNAPIYNKLLVHSHNQDLEDWKSTETDNSLHSEKHSTYIPENILHSKIIPESITLRNGDQEKHSKSLSNVTTRRDRTEQTQKETVDSIPTKTSQTKISDSSRKFTNGAGTISNGSENLSSDSITTERESHASDRNTEESDKVPSKSITRNSKRSENFMSLYTETHPSVSITSRMSKLESNLQNINTRRGSGTFSESDKLTEVLPLKEPMLSLTVANKETKGKYDGRRKSKLTKNIALKPDRSRGTGDFNDTNEIHLKFEAEIHLLNDFNESLRQFSAVEKAFESLKSKNDSNVTLHKILQNRDTQTSVGAKSSISSSVTEYLADTSESQISTVNYSRGSVIDIDLNNLNLDSTVSKQEENTGLASTGLEISNLNKSMSSVVESNPDLSNFENLQSGNFAGMSLRMFEQLIKDEDVRLDNLKTILKIREQALLDRTKGELAWLEIQRKHLRETGKLHEASLIKKKQRGILVNHQKEKHEMQRLKQMQKAASLERKIILKEQRNLIKHQLSTDNMLSKMKVNTPRERRLSGPLKVVQSHTESIRSETSISRRSSSDKDKDVYSITSRTHSVVSKVSEVPGDEMNSKDGRSDVDVVDIASKLTSEVPGVPISKMKRSLLMREAALQKRRRAAEELLQWHKKLLEEERRITELELAANAIISHIPNNVMSGTDVEEKYKFKGKQLNQLWFNLTGCEVKKFAEDKIYPMSQIALERFCKSARQYSSKTKKILRKVSDSDINSDYSGPRSEGSVSENIPDQKDPLSASIRMEFEHSHKQTSSRNEVVPTATLSEYTSDFDVESIEDIVNEDMDVVDQSINRLINNFSKIKEDISSLSLKQSLKSGEDREQDESQKTDSDVEISVIETNKTSKEEEEKSDSEEVVLRLTSEGQTSTSNKNASILEEIKNDLHKSEEVLLRLSEADKGKLTIEESLVTSTEENNLSKTDDGVLSLKSKQDKISTDVSEMVSNKKSSEIQEVSKEEYGSASKEKESLSKLSKTENSISTDVSSKKDSSGKDKNQVTCEEKGNLNKTEEILGQLEEKVNTSTSSIERSPTIEENHLSSEEENSMNSKDFLQRLSQSEEIVSMFASGDDILSGNKSLVVEENRVSIDSKDNVSKAEEILLRLSPSEGKISTDVPSDILSQKLEENEVFNESKDNLSKTEEILAKLSQGVYRVSSDNSDDVADSNKSSVISENSSNNYINDLNKSEEIALRMQQEKGSGDSYSNKAPSIIEEMKTSSEKLKTEEDLVKVNEEDKISTVSKDVSITQDVSTPNKVSSKESEDEHKYESALEDKREVSEGATREISEKSSSSFKETDVDEELSIDEDPRSDNVEEQIRKSPIEKIIDIKDGEDTPVGNNQIVNDQKTQEITELADQISKEPTSTNKDISSEPIKVTESKEESELRRAESGKTSVEKSITKASEKNKAQSSGISELTTPNKEDLSQRTVSDVYTEFEETNKTTPLSKEDINSYEEKEQDSLSSTSGSQVSMATEKEDKSITSTRSKSYNSEEKSPKVDVKKRVSEIMADASQLSRGDKSPRLQDLYITTYDLVSPANSPELGSPIEENKLVAAKSVFGTEAEELLRKQLAIEQEIKQITEQQQKEQLPYLFVREIPNKPPPPYIPPSSQPPVNVITIVPTTDEIEEISKYSAKILHKAYLTHNLDNISISENTLGLISKNITKECYKFVFDLCKEISKEHYKQFEKEKCPSWLQVTKKPQLTVVRPLDVGGLEKHLNKNLKELFGYEKPERRENAIIKWSRKNRDHVDEILVMESQAEETQWTNYDKDELLIMNEATNEIMNMLLKETGQVFSKILSKRTYLY